jgi:hypothetical protein
LQKEIPRRLGWKGGQAGSACPAALRSLYSLGLLPSSLFPAKGTKDAAFLAQEMRPRGFPNWKGPSPPSTPTSCRDGARDTGEDQEVSTETGERQAWELLQRHCKRWG